MGDRERAKGKEKPDRKVGVRCVGEELGNERKEEKN